MLYKVPFYLGNFFACFVPGTERRRHTRAYVNLLLFYPAIRRFIRRAYGERIQSIKFIRQISLGRVVFLVNGKYFVKIFRDVTNARLKDHEFLLNYAIKQLGKDSLIIPIVVAKHVPMYACEKVSGEHVYEFPPEKIIKNNAKIKKQVFSIIDALQKIDVSKIPNNARFMYSMQKKRTRELPGGEKQVLAHFDMNTSNFLFDENMNICAVIDWDTLSIAQNNETDKRVFLKHWDPFIVRMRERLTPPANRKE